MTFEELERLNERMRSLYHTIRECRERVNVPAIARALELAEMHLHHALWLGGADVGLNPDCEDH